MSEQYCPECGHKNPGEARFCMQCATPLAGQQSPAAGSGSPQRERTDWATIVAAVLAFLSLRHMSRKARDTTIVVLLLMLFFGCPMVCGFMAFAMEWFARLFQ
jgi:uncharacterized membrane protein YvbJ